jgi:hypothetical protein
MKIKDAIITALGCMFIYSFVAMAYLHSTFVSKDFLEQLCLRLDRIENKIDALIGGKYARK